MVADFATLDERPGFRRRFAVAVGDGWVRSAVEDDFHCMRVTIRHDGQRATSVEGEVMRAPWTTCPAAGMQLKKTYEGVALSDFLARGDKQSNCTHLHDLALLGAAHAFDAQPPSYEVLVSDPIEGRRHAEIRRNGQRVLGWIESGMRLVEPAELAGMTLDKLRPWIDSLTADQQEAARLLRWANMMANGRQIPMEQQSDASRMPSNCYTFQPGRKEVAKRVGPIRDFSRQTAQPLDGIAITDRGRG